MRNSTSTAIFLRRALGHFPGIGGLARLWTERAELARERRALGRLDAHLLKDIGIDPERARREARRARWDAPEHWRS